MIYQKPQLELVHEKYIKMEHISFDLETLGNTSNAPIVQIGAVKFNNDGVILDSFKRNIDIESLEKFNFKVNYNTIKWWLNQDKAAIDSVFNNTYSVSIFTALEDFQKWIGKPNNYVYWSHATFDPPILVNNFIMVGLKNIIPYKLYRDIRTLIYLTGKTETKREGIHHDALDDAKFQAEYINEALKKIKL